MCVEGRHVAGAGAVISGVLADDGPAQVLDHAAVPRRDAEAAANLASAAAVREAGVQHADLRLLADGRHNAVVLALHLRDHAGRLALSVEEERHVLHPLHHPCCVGLTARIHAHRCRQRGVIAQGVVAGAAPPEDHVNVVRAEHVVGDKVPVCHPVEHPILVAHSLQARLMQVVVLGRDHYAPALPQQLKVGKVGVGEDCGALDGDRDEEGRGETWVGRLRGAPLEEHILVTGTGDVHYLVV
mmetsp:Transcript_25776/g.59959  ORF Transcript_25776/g.59959 Transcript_25776/m.59959 type:complete len:242 (-) Transcript_25776:1023-1748(-)